MTTKIKKVLVSLCVSTGICFSGVALGTTNLTQQIKQAYGINGSFKPTLVRILERGFLTCDKRIGSHTIPDKMAELFCKNLARAIFGEGNSGKLIIQQNDTPTALAKIRSGEVDVSYRAVMPGESGDLNAYAPTWFYDAPTFIHSRIQEVEDAESVAEVVDEILPSERSLCIVDTPEFRNTAAQLGYTGANASNVVLLEDFDELVDAFNGDRPGNDFLECPHALVTESVLPLGFKQGLESTTNTGVRLTKTTSSAFYDSRDPHFGDIVFWVTNAPIEAEMCGITKKIAEDNEAPNPLESCVNLLNQGATPMNFTSERLFLNSPQAFRDVIRENGNWAEMFDFSGGTTRSDINQLCWNGGAICSHDVR